MGKGLKFTVGMWETETSTKASKEESNGSKKDGKLILVLVYQKIKIFRCGSGFGF